MESLKNRINEQFSMVENKIENVTIDSVNYKIKELKSNKFELENFLDTEKDFYGKTDFYSVDKTDNKLTLELFDNIGEISTLDQKNIVLAIKDLKNKFESIGFDMFEKRTLEFS